MTSPVEKTLSSHLPVRSVSTRHREPRPGFRQSVIRRLDRKTPSAAEKVRSPTSGRYPLHRSPHRPLAEGQVHGEGPEVVAGQIDWSANQPMEPGGVRPAPRPGPGVPPGRELFVFDGFACADPRYRLPLRVVTEKAWHSLFARCLFLRPTPEQLPAFDPEWTVLHACDFHADPARDGTKSEVCVAISFEQRLVVACGTHYAGEIKKAMFTVLNYLLPQKGVFPMHCSANVGQGGDVALFFGLSGTGKTTLCADPERRLIGDDEHGWGDDGVFNIEGGCYAKTIKLSAAGEPQIWNAIRFGCVLENVPVDPLTRKPDFDSARSHGEHPGRVPGRLHPELRTVRRGRAPDRTCSS